jgi:hypothetical protein
MVTSSDKECVKVVIRCRPMNKREKEGNYETIVTVDEAAASITVSDSEKNQKTFTFDYSFPSDCRQIDVYNKTARPIVEAVLQGCKNIG